MGAADYLCSPFNYKHQALKRFFKILKYTVLSLLALVLLVIVLVNFTPVQNFIVSRATNYLTEKTGSTFKVEHIKISLRNKVHIQGVYVEDQQKDTLLYAGEISLRITDWFVFKNETPVLHYVGLKDVYANLNRDKTSDNWNYQFIIDAFDSGTKDTTKKEAAPIDIDLEELELENIRFLMNDAWVGSDLNLLVGKFDINADEVSIPKKIIDIAGITAENTHVILRDYDGGRPPKERIVSNEIDTTAFNPGNWKINVGALNLEYCYFDMDVGNKPALDNEFDYDHIHISGIQLDADDLSINGDTLTAEMALLSAHERCGLNIKKMQADVTVSPNESTCKNLELITDNSIIRNHYSMHYSRFPDFNDYLEKVEMHANFRNATISLDDIAYFAPVLREYSTTANISGKIKGTVSDIAAKDLVLNDGITTVKGDLKMAGLPDIEKTFIDFSKGELTTNGKGILKYAPTLRDSSGIGVDSISNLHFTGDFKGYINNFLIDGTINSNLGNIVSDLKMEIPEHKDSVAIYKGDINVANLNLGALLLNEDLGTVTLIAQINGRSTLLEKANLKFKTAIEHFDYKGYRYTSINADGNLVNKRFTGNLLVDDPYIAFGFYGMCDFSKEKIIIDAKANLLQSNLTALNLVEKDTILLSADFDMDWQGHNIDDFIGYAKLYNIDLSRNGRRLDLDSVYVNATEEGESKKLTINSNAFYAYMQGSYELSSLHKSFLYYVSGYIPNYIHPMKDHGAHQNLSFTVKTRALDKLFEIFNIDAQGFDESVIEGSLATPLQSLELKGHIPFGKYNDIEVHDFRLKANGDFKKLNVITDAGNVALGDSTVKGTFYLNTTVANDNLDFNIATTSPTALGAATVAGKIKAHGDTLTCSIAPSEFFMNQSKWHILGNNEIVYADQYLSINNFIINSNGQTININSSNLNNTQQIDLVLSKINVGSIGNLVNIEDYNPQGKINGTATIQNLFTKLKVTTDIKVSDLVLDNDTLGTIIAAGSYDSEKKLANLNEKSGVFYNNKFIKAFGKISFDSTHRETINGTIELSKAPMAWLKPVLNGYVSDISGYLDGKVNIGGSSETPDINGNISIDEAHMHIDFLGTNYTIPTGLIVVNNQAISLKGINIFDGQKNKAKLTGGILHNRFKKMRLDLNLASNKFKVIDLKSYESDVFYGDFTAKFESLEVKGPFDDVHIRINKAEPAAKSTLYLPLSSEVNNVGAYSYISFKSEYDTIEIEEEEKSKLTIHIEALMNPLASISMIMDPTTGDAINASGSGNINIEIPPSNDIRMYGNFAINEGDYTFTLPQLFFKRKFLLDQQSKIQFTGPINNTQLDVKGVYRTQARLYDVLRDDAKNSLKEFASGELDAATALRDIDIYLFMRGSLANPKLDFDIDVPDKSVANNVAYKALEVINQDEQDQFTQVASLLILNSFKPPGEAFGSGGGGLANNVGGIVSGTASSQLTNLMSKLTGSKSLSIDLKYQQYSYNAGGESGANSRNSMSFAVRQNLFKDRMSVQVGSSLDWGKPTSNTKTSNFNPVGDFRLQYLFKEGGNLRGNLFSKSGYDVVSNQNISRTGVGLSWRRSFNTLGEFLGTSKGTIRKEDEEEENKEDADK